MRLLSFAAVLFVLVPCYGDEKPKTDNDKVIDFIDNGAKYKGKTLTFEVTYRTTVPLRETAGQEVRYRLRDSALKTDAWIEIGYMAGLEVPNLRDGDVAFVTFESKLGLLEKGNIATKIVRK